MSERTESEISIAAAPDVIMATIADLAAYPEWCPGVHATEVLQKYPDGRPMVVEMSFDSGPIRDTHVYRYDAWSDKEVRWHLTSGTTVTGLWGVYACAVTDASSTQVTYRLAMDLAVPIIGALKRRAEKEIVRTALRGLKERVEGTRL